MRKINFRTDGVYQPASGKWRRVIATETLLHRNGTKVETVTFTNGKRNRTVLRDSFRRWASNTTFAPRESFGS